MGCDAYYSDITTAPARALRDWETVSSLLSSPPAHERTHLSPQLPHHLPRLSHLHPDPPDVLLNPI